jgi:hypothetical protein
MKSTEFLNESISEDSTTFDFNGFVSLVKDLMPSDETLDREYGLYGNIDEKQYQQAYQEFSAGKYQDAADTLLQNYADQDGGEGRVEHLWIDLSDDLHNSDMRESVTEDEGDQMLYQVRCIGTFYGGKYRETGMDSIFVLAGSEDEALQIAQSNKDAVVKHFLNKRYRKGSGSTPAMMPKHAGSLKIADSKPFPKQRAYSKVLTSAGQFQPVNLDENITEAHKPGKRIIITKGSYKGQTGSIGEVKHGLYKGAPKSYVIDLDNGGNVQLSSNEFKALKNNVTEDGNLEQLVKQYHDAKKSLDMLDNWNQNPGIVSKEKANIARLKAEIEKLQPDYFKPKKAPEKTDDQKLRHKIRTIAGKVVHGVDRNQSRSAINKDVSADPEDVLMNDVYNGRMTDDETRAFIKQYKDEILAEVPVLSKDRLFRTHGWV